MKVNEDSGHFNDDMSYMGSGCTSPHDELTVVGNQPTVEASMSTTEMQTQSIPHYPGNSPKLGIKKNY